MSERPFMQLYVSDFVGDTLHLSAELVGAYMLLLMAMWNAGGSLPNDPVKLARVARLTLKKWGAASPDLMPFFDIDDNQISHGRLLKELRKSESKSELRAAAGAEGGRAKALKDKKARQANAKPMPQHLPEARNQKEKPSVSQTCARSEFEQWYELYPHKVSKGDAKRAFPKALAKAGSLEVLIDGVRRYVASKPEDRAWRNPATWLNGEGWLDAPATGATVTSISAPVVEDREAWTKRLGYARRNHEWSTPKWGPMPGQPGCRVPDDLLELGDGQGWNEMRSAA